MMVFSKYYLVNMKLPKLPSLNIINSVFFGKEEVRIVESHKDSYSVLKTLPHKRFIRTPSLNWDQL